jgi:hypothetical protein
VRSEVPERNVEPGHGPTAAPACTIPAIDLVNNMGGARTESGPPRWSPPAVFTGWHGSVNNRTSPPPGNGARSLDAGFPCAVGSFFGAPGARKVTRPAIPSPRSSPPWWSSPPGPPPAGLQDPTRDRSAAADPCRSTLRPPAARSDRPGRSALTPHGRPTAAGCTCRPTRAACSTSGGSAFRTAKSNSSRTGRRKKRDRRGGRRPLPGYVTASGLRGFRRILGIDALASR